MVVAAISAVAAHRADGDRAPTAIRTEQPAKQQAMKLQKIKTIARHLWFDASDAKRAISPAILQRLADRVAASERRHTGQIRIYVEAAMPLSYVTRLDRHVRLKNIVRERAVMQFGKLQVWDTAQNNGVLIYLLLAEHAIEIVADRGLSLHVSAEQWQQVVARMAATFQQKRFEEGLGQALEEVSTLLVTYFPASQDGPGRINELPDTPFLG